MTEPQIIPLQFFSSLFFNLYIDEIAMKKNVFFFAQQILTNTHICMNAIFASLLELLYIDSSVNTNIQTKHVTNFGR